jgi:deoxycytidine triphosphate deaminase
MLLNSYQIQTKNLIAEQFENTQLHASSYDLRVDKMIGRGEKGDVFVATDSLVIQPMGMVTVISRESLRLPQDVTAYAMVKTGLCRSGVLAINIGIFDPGWEGPGSSILLNFGKEPYQIRRNDGFLRLTFHCVQAPSGSPKPSVHMRSDYEREVTTSFSRKFAATFMDVEQAATKARSKLDEELKSVLLKWLPAAAIFLAFLTFFLNYGVLAIASHAIPMPSDVVSLKVKELTSDLNNDVQRLRAENEDLRKQIKALANQIAAQAPRKQ